MHGRVRGDTTGWAAAPDFFEFPVLVSANRRITSLHLCFRGSGGPPHSDCDTESQTKTSELTGKTPTFGAGSSIVMDTASSKARVYDITTHEMSTGEGAEGQK